MAADFARPSQQPQFNVSPAYAHYSLLQGNYKPTAANATSATTMNSSSSSPLQSQVPMLLSPSNSSPATTHNSSPDSSRAGSTPFNATASSAGAPAQTTTAPGGATPQHHHMPFQTRQLRPPKLPLYMPAVLRPNEFPPTTRGRNSKPASEASTSPPSPPQSLDDRATSEALKRRSTGDSGKFGFGFGLAMASPPVKDDSSSESWGRVSALPTRQHWKADQDSTICDDTSCTKYFSYFTRRHHCRRCGHIFCDEHSRYSVPLDQDANFHPNGALSRACTFCFSEYKAWELARWSRSNSESSTNTANADTPTTPGAIMAPVRTNAMSAVMGGKKDGLSESLSASVPRDWNWSTF